MNPSLLIIPDRYKAAKLYSQIPESGAGDFTVIRGTTATRVNASGLIESVASGVPRIDYTGGGCGKLLVEPAATNLLLHSNDFANAYWSKTAALTANTDVSPDGTINASTFNDNSDLFQDVRRSIASIDASVDYVFSIYIKKTAGVLSHYPAIGVSLGGGFAAAYLILNTTTGTFNLADAVGGAFSGHVESFNANYWRIELVLNSIYTSALLLIYPALSTNGTTLNSNAQGTNVFYGTQFEKGSRATSYIPTVAATVTRNADVVSLSSASGLIGQTEGTIYAQFNIDRSVIGTLAVIAGADTFNFLSIAKLATRQIRIQIRNAGGSIVSIILSSALALGLHKIAIGYTNGDYALYIDGTLAGTSTNNTNYPALPLTRLVLSDINFGFLNDTYSSIALYPTRLTNSELAALTTL